MAFREKLTSIIGSILRIGTTTASRIAIKNNAGVMEARDNADAAYINVRGADPVIDDDLVTLRYFNAVPPAGGVAVIRYTVTFSGGAAQDSVTSMPAGARVLEAREEVTVTWNGVGASVNVGDTTTPAAFIATADVDLTTADLYAFPQDTAVTGPSVVRSTVTAGAGATQGTSIITVFFAVPDL